MDKRIRRHATLVEFTDQSAMKSLFHQAYFLFASEIPHNTTWRSLVLTVAACDTGGSLRDFLKSRPNNATYLSSTTVTSILESFGDALSKELKTRMAMVQKYSLMADESMSMASQSLASVSATCKRRMLLSSSWDAGLCLQQNLRTYLMLSSPSYTALD